MKEQTLKDEITMARAAWRQTREKRLALMDGLLDQGQDIRMVRCDRRYRSLKKEQRRYAGVIRHLEQKLNRIMSRTNEKNQE